MAKKLTIEEIENSVLKVDTIEAPSDPTEKTSLTENTATKPTLINKKKKRRKIRRIIILCVVVIILTVIGWFGWISYQSVKSIFAGQSAPNLLGFFESSPLKGESSGRVNILLLGIGDPNHAGALLSDTMIVISYDVKTKQVAMLSVPRDLYVNIKNYGYAKINTADSVGGPTLSEQTVSSILNLPIDYYVRMDFTGFTDLINAVGGVDINVKKELYDPYYPGPNDIGQITIDFKPGEQHMNGTQALEYARSRETTSDFDRSQRQQQVLVALKGKLFSSSTLANVSKLSNIIQILGNNVTTDFQTSNFQTLLNISKQVNTNNIINKGIDDTVPNGLLKADNDTSAGDILIPRLGLGNYTELQDLANNIFSIPQIQTDNARVEVLNGTSDSSLGTKASATLKSLGYNVVYTGSAGEYQANTAIYDCSNGSKTGTVNALEQLLNVSTAQNTCQNSSYDIEIILGQDYNS